MATPSPAPGGSAGRTRDPYAVFRARRGRQFALGMAAAQLVVFLVLAVVLPLAGPEEWGVPDSVMLVVLGLLIAWALGRYAALRATPSPAGIVVRNIIVTTTVEWSQVVGVRFSGGDPWAFLDLASGDDLAVMAIQKSDGAYARSEASRLAALARAHGPGAEGRGAEGRGAEGRGAEGTRGEGTVPGGASEAPEVDR
jgi:hypothetical protein